jgi:hypothetical protein
LSDRSPAHGAKVIINTVNPAKVITRKTMITLITLVPEDHPGPA